MNTPLPTPAETRTARDAKEIASVWLVDETPTYVLGDPKWDDVAAWGIVIADLARHVAAAYSGGRATTEREVLKRIRAGFEVELDSPPRS
jgi:hypothetical protein